MKTGESVTEQNSNVRPKKGGSIIAFPSEYVVIDIETMGFAQDDSIIELGALKKNRKNNHFVKIRK